MASALTTNGSILQKLFMVESVKYASASAGIAASNIEDKSCKSDSKKVSKFTT